MNMTQKPAPFFGPEDMTCDEDPRAVEACINDSRAAWDAAYSRLNWWSRVKLCLGFHVDYPEI